MINIPGHEPPTMHEYERLVVYISIQPNNNSNDDNNNNNNNCAKFIYDTLPNFDNTSQQQQQQQQRESKT